MFGREMPEWFFIGGMVVIIIAGFLAIRMLVRQLAMWMITDETTKWNLLYKCIALLKRMEEITKVCPEDKWKMLLELQRGSVSDWRKFCDELDVVVFNADHDLQSDPTKPFG